MGYLPTLQNIVLSYGDSAPHCCDSRVDILQTARAALATARSSALAPFSCGLAAQIVKQDTLDEVHLYRENMIAYKAFFVNPCFVQHDIDRRANRSLQIFHNILQNGHPNTGV